LLWECLGKLRASVLFVVSGDAEVLAKLSLACVELVKVLSW